MRSRLTRGLLTAAALLVSACTHAGINPTVEQEELTPPTPITSGGPALVGATPDRPVSLDILVAIDTLGHAELSTLQITGPGAEMNRKVVTDWLRSAEFDPARLNGYPVRGWFRVKADAKASSARG